MVADAPKRRRSSRGHSALEELAARIVDGDFIVVITGAGISVASGVRPFRSSAGDRGPRQQCLDNGIRREAVAASGIWNDVIWTTATKESFRRDPARWYNEFWIPYFFTGPHSPNAAHDALVQLLERDNVYQITQNIDGLQSPHPRLIEAHGRLDVYRCLAEEDSDTDDDEDDDDDREVHLGHRRKVRHLLDRLACPEECPYQYLQTLSPSQIEPPQAREVLSQRRGRLSSTPRCPMCDHAVAPAALLFDEGYHSHDLYDFESAEQWLAAADALVFIGTSFSVRITDVALDHARAQRLPVYNLNPDDFLEPTARLNASNIVGKADELLPRLVALMERLEEEATTTPSTTSEECLC